MLKKLIRGLGAVLGVVLLSIGGWWFTRTGTPEGPLTADSTPLQGTYTGDDSYVKPLDRDLKEFEAEIPGLIGTKMQKRKPYRLIGYSVEGREIQSYKYGTGARKILFVGATHGGYAWNTALLAYQVVDHLIASPFAVPGDMQVLVVPVLNPDGLFRVVGTSERFGLSVAPQFVHANDVLPTDLVVSGRFNAHGVDVNRNFACEWQPSATWRQYTVSAGAEAFSEPEAAALRDFVIAEQPMAVVFFESASGGIYGSRCGETVLPGTDTLLSTYSVASGYPAHATYGHYAITGAATDWLTTQGIPAITVELTTHNEIEWNQNKSGIEALFKLYSEVE